MFESLTTLVREYFDTADYIALHEPRFNARAKALLNDVIESSFVSTVGPYVTQFEQQIAAYTGVKHAVATVNGTSALHLSLLAAGVLSDELVITQSLTFVATCNAIVYCNAQPLFVDVDRETLGLSATALEEFLSQETLTRDDGSCWHKASGKRIRACVPMHTYGYPLAIDAIARLCKQYGVTLVEDSAEALGSFVNAHHCGTFGIASALSFNGNKVLTTGGGGMVLTNNDSVAERVRHLSTTAKQVHGQVLSHDDIGYNYRLPNLNAALGVAQLESLPSQLEQKRQLSTLYRQWSDEHGIHSVQERGDCRANHWLNTIVCDTPDQRDKLLHYTADRQIGTRPAWQPMHQLSMYAGCVRGALEQTVWLAERLITLPSSARHA